MNEIATKEKWEPMTSPAERVGMGEDERRSERALEPATKRDDTVPARTLEQLGGEIRLLTAQARWMALSYAIQIGYRLKAAHEKVGPHGWADWLKQETEFSAAAASRFEALYEGYGEEQGSLFGVGNKFPTLEKISVSNALRLLAVPEEEREQVAREVDAEHLSARELEKALAERDEARKAAEEAESLAERMTAERVELQGALQQAETEKARLTLRVKEMESKPVEVAVERDEDAIREAAEEARKKAEDAASKETDRLKNELEKAQAAQKKAEKDAEEAAKRAAEDAGPYKAEAEKAKAEAEALRKKLVSAESGANVAAALFSVAQLNFGAALEKVTAMKATHADVADKLLTGMETVLSRLTEQIREARGC